MKLTLLTFLACMIKAFCACSIAYIYTNTVNELNVINADI